MTDDEPAAIRGVVRFYDTERGWGVIDAPEVPGGCWVHYSMIETAGHRGLVTGRQVTFSWEPVANQDGYRFRALTVRPGDGAMR
ncbi:cold shock domain-containing protein [Frankia sp. AiPs1]|uniref:cold-shock protein n=1 Tax=Frankia sp. AiPs1 TaxID=573493 RepID=UPI0020444185|nr:cold shock domain-containing protein [Frankia sp. AiPs1]MCM3926332.1 cold shock domain-containing protein [Frankia sp. AiPs1]